MADGFWVFLEPLSLGQHEISFAVNVLDDPATPTTDEVFYRHNLQCYCQIVLDHLKA